MIADRFIPLRLARALKALTDGWVERLEYDLAIDRHESSSAWKLESALGLLLLLGATIALGFGTVYEVWIDPEAPLWVQVGLSLGAGGTVVLLAAAIRWRLATAAKDPYSEVIR